jgi:hypothetical protein
VGEAQARKRRQRESGAADARDQEGGGD